jgi:hypothetical protein
MIGYRLTAERAAETRRQLDERDAQLAGPTPDTVLQVRNALRPRAGRLHVASLGPEEGH